MKKLNQQFFYLNYQIQTLEFLFEKPFNKLIISKNKLGLKNKNKFKKYFIYKKNNIKYFIYKKNKMYFIFCNSIIFIILIFIFKNIKN